MAFASPICLMARAFSTKSWLWHQRLSHLNFDTINDLTKNDLVSGLPKFKYHKEHIFPSCEQGKSKRASHPPKPIPNSRQRFNKTPYELINGKKPDISFLHVFWALCYPKNDRKDIGKLGAKDTAPTPTNSSYLATNFPSTSRDVDELNLQQQRAQQQGIQAHLQSETVADNVSNAIFDGNTFVNPFVNPSTSAAESSSSQNVDPLNMHTFYQPYPHEFQWTKDHPLELVIGEPSRPVLTQNQLRSYGDMCMIFLAYAAHKSFFVFQMNMKTAFFHGSLKEDMYVCQYEGFIDVDHPSHIYKLKKALYGLKQAPRA
nr:integrase, catalytic region, zinc finger, CCHC-type, peptidase aspartic, catalytic [Tanacetum cinerariifolium]